MNLPFLHSERRFVPPRNVERVREAYLPGFNTYTDYNYLHKNSIISSIKRKHFEVALELTKDLHGRATKVIDFGCGDGPFLPSLSKYFTEVLGVDSNADFIDVANQLVDASGLTNVRTMCSSGLSTGEFIARIGGAYDVLFLLEVMEHIGVKERMYESKLEFLDGLSPLVAANGLFVISVPIMVGFRYLLQRMGLSAFNMRREPITFRQLFRLGIFSDTTELEAQWQNSAHLGFNHKKLEGHFPPRFEIVKKWSNLFQVVYVLRRRLW